MEQFGQATNRIAYLDGLRGVAILLVVFFHYYYLFPTNDFVSYGISVGTFPLVRYGYLGVMLFFCISGFVITQTLHNSKGYLHFFIKRFSRLFPSMFVCSLLTYLIAFIGLRTYSVSLYDFIPSWTFISPKVFNLLSDSSDFKWIDGVYWSLFAEVRFYAIIALVYFSFGDGFRARFLSFAMLIGFLFPLSILLGIGKLRSALNLFFVASQLPWFVFGVGCYYLHHGDKRWANRYFVVSSLTLGLYILSSFMRPYMKFDPSAYAVGAILIFGLLICAIQLPTISKMLAFRPLAAVGVASYSLYLAHEEIGQKIILTIDVAIRNRAGFNGLAVWVPVGVLLAFVVFSWLLYSFYESPSNRLLNKALGRFVLRRD